MHSCSYGRGELKELWFAKNNKVPFKFLISFTSCPTQYTEHISSYHMPHVQRRRDIKRRPLVSQTATVACSGSSSSNQETASLNCCYPEKKNNQGYAGLKSPMLVAEYLAEDANKFLRQYGDGRGLIISPAPPTKRSQIHPPPCSKSELPKMQATNQEYCSITTRSSIGAGFKLRCATLPNHGKEF